MVPDYEAHGSITYESQLPGAQFRWPHHTPFRPTTIQVIGHGLRRGWLTSEETHPVGKGERGQEAAPDSDWTRGKRGRGGPVSPGFAGVPFLQRSSCVY
jgi:hypothetical protein